MPATTYTARARSDTPALLIFLIDRSESMKEPFGEYASKADCVTDLLRLMFRGLIKQCRAGDSFKNRYHVSIIAYDEDAESLFPQEACIDQYAPPGRRMLVPLDVIRKQGVPRLGPQYRTNPAAAFQLAQEILEREVPIRAGTSPIDGQPFPAPIICHLTDGERTQGFQSALDLSMRIRSMGTGDGGALVSNIFLGPSLLREPIQDVKAWPGVFNAGEINSPYGQELFQMSSTFPPSYKDLNPEVADYAFQGGARMLFPASNPEILKLAFIVAGGTPTGAEAAKKSR